MTSCPPSRGHPRCLMLLLIGVVVGLPCRSQALSGLALYGLATLLPVGKLGLSDRAGKKKKIRCGQERSELQGIRG